MTFNTDLILGHYYEKKAILYLDYDNYKIIDGYHKEYDIIISKNGITTKIEVKTDRLAYKTGNIVIEYEYNNKPSGIETTTADFWIYFVINPNKEECYKFPIEELKNIVKNCKTVRGGDGYKSKLYIIKKSKLKKYLINKILV